MLLDSVENQSCSRAQRAARARARPGAPFRQGVLLLLPPHHLLVVFVALATHTAIDAVVLPHVGQSARS
eukprot:6204211-Pleurochrysis_carterae.AAC.1